MPTVKILPWILGFLFIASASQTFSQPPAMPGMGPHHGMRYGRGEPTCWAASELTLSPDQAKAYDLLSRTYFQEAKRYRMELFSKRLELREYLTDPSVRTESIQAKNLEIVELQSKLEGKTTEFLIQVRNLLTQEQLKSWCPEQEFPMVQRMMDRPFRMGPMTPGPPQPSETPKKD
jgi:hypothetical protein